VIKTITIVAAVLVCLLAAWINAKKKAATAVRPTVGATNLVAFLETQAQTNQIRSFIHNGKVYVMVIGKPSLSPLSVPSGSPAYIFDETGAFVDWCRDLGDAPTFVKKWGSFNNATQISVEQAKQLVKTNGL
jgi:Rieske Fe-S protein